MIFAFPNIGQILGLFQPFLIHSRSFLFPRQSPNVVVVVILFIFIIVINIM